MGAGGGQVPITWVIFENVLLQRCILAKIQPKNLKLVHYLLLAVRGNIRFRPATKGTRGTKPT